MTDDSFAIRLPQFEGPFDLLLFFIERDELDIHDIPIAKIADDFLNYIHQMTSLNMELASEFIFVAATLMRIKAKMLLPRYEAENGADDADTKENLIRKLIEYKKFKELCEELRPYEEERFKQEKRGNINLRPGTGRKSSTPRRRTIRNKPVQANDGTRTADAQLP
jgi:segregation and condensation protein A